MLHKILLNLLICGVLAHGEAPCTGDFKPVGEKCLHIMESPVTWSNAKINCLTINGQRNDYPHLAYITTPEQLKDIVDYLNNTGKEISVWIGGNDNTDEGTWIYKAETPVPMGTPFWVTTEVFTTPNGGKDQNCAEMSYNNGFLMNDDDCSNTRYALCESDDRKVGESISVPEETVNDGETKCPLFYVKIGDQCFSLITWEVVPWEDVESVCKRFEGYPAMIKDIGILRDFYEYVNDQGIATHSYWTAGNMSNSDIWVWDSKGEDKVTMGTPFWGNSEVRRFYPEPDGDGAERCLALTAEGKYFFRDRICSEPMSPLCMADPIPVVEVFA